MITVLWVAAIISGFLFPAFLIAALQPKEEREEDGGKYVLLSCLTFGLIIMAILCIY